jgi:hypothetical protein
MKKQDVLYTIAAKLYLEATKANDFMGTLIAVSAIDKLKSDRRMLSNHEQDSNL